MLRFQDGALLITHAVKVIANGSATVSPLRVILRTLLYTGRKAIYWLLILYGLRLKGLNYL